MRLANILSGRDFKVVMNKISFKFFFSILKITNYKFYQRFYSYVYSRAFNKTSTTFGIYWDICSRFISKPKGYYSQSKHKHIMTYRWVYWLLEWLSIQIKGVLFLHMFSKHTITKVFPFFIFCIPPHLF